MIDFLAGGLELTALYVLGDKKRCGFLLNVLVDLLWIYVAVSMEIYGMLLVVVPAVVINLRNYLRWSREA